MFKQEQRARIFSEMLRPQPTNLECGRPNIYSADDMRLFHHYLVLVPPTLAIEGQDLWTRDLPTYSHRVRMFSVSSIGAIPTLVAETAIKYKHVSNWSIWHRLMLIVAVFFSYARYTRASG